MTEPKRHKKVTGWICKPMFWYGTHMHLSLFTWHKTPLTIWAFYVPPEWHLQRWIKEHVYDFYDEGDYRSSFIAHMWPGATKCDNQEIVLLQKASLAVPHRATQRLTTLHAAEPPATHAAFPTTSHLSVRTSDTLLLGNHQHWWRCVTADGGTQLRMATDWQLIICSRLPLQMLTWNCTNPQHLMYINTSLI